MPAPRWHRWEAKALPWLAWPPPDCQAPGFHLTTSTYRRFVSTYGLQEPILAAVSSVAADQPATLEQAARKIEELFTGHAMPEEIAQAIRQAYASLGGENLPVAVRSSATAEDLPELSFEPGSVDRHEPENVPRVN